MLFPLFVAGPDTMLNVTGNPELDVAATVKFGEVVVLSGMELNVIVCEIHEVVLTVND